MQLGSFNYRLLGVALAVSLAWILVDAQILYCYECTSTETKACSARGVFAMPCTSGKETMCMTTFVDDAEKTVIRKCTIPPKGLNVSEIEDDEHCETPPVENGEDERTNCYCAADKCNRNTSCADWPAGLLVTAMQIAVLIGLL